MDTLRINVGKQPFPPPFGVLSALSSTLVFIERRGENMRREDTGKWMPPLLFSSRGVACCSWNSPPPPPPPKKETDRELVPTLPPVIQP